MQNGREPWWERKNRVSRSIEPSTVMELDNIKGMSVDNSINSVYDEEMDLLGCFTSYRGRRTSMLGQSKSPGELEIEDVGCVNDMIIGGVDAVWGREGYRPVRYMMASVLEVWTTNEVCTAERLYAIRQTIQEDRARGRRVMKRESLFVENSKF